MTPLDEARARLQAGDFSQAERIVREALAATPGSPDAMELLGAVLGAQGRHEDALEAFEQTLRARPGSMASLHNRALALLALGRAREAREDLQRIVAALPQLLSAWTALGRAHAMLGELHGAERAFRQAAALDQASPRAVMNLAFFLRAAGRLPEAIEQYAAAVQRWPNDPELVVNLGALYQESGRLAEAERCHRRALELSPGMARAQISLGNIHALQGRTDESIEMYRAVLARAPDNADVQSNLGIALQEKGDLEGAKACYEQALAASPGHADALNNLGYLLQHEGRVEEAVRLYERALELNPRLARAQYNLASTRLAAHRFAEGWKLAESRFAVVPPVAVDRSYRVARLTQENLADARKVAVWAEQGIGDQVLYGTMLPDLAARVAFVLEVDPRLVPAFRRAHPDWEVVGPEHSAAAFMSCDRHVPVGSLGMILRPDLASFARQPAALLAADPARARAMRESLRAGERKVIGISWRSFQAKDRRVVERAKSAPLAEFLQLSRRDDVILLDLQYGDTAEERRQFAALGGRLARMEGLDLFEDVDGVLAAIEACDRVITTSNVTAHFAGAIGQDARLIYPAGVPPFHYWATDASGRCLWYPSVRIVTRAGACSWNDLVARAAAIQGTSLSR